MNKITIGVIGILSLLGVILGGAALVGNHPAAPNSIELGAATPGTRFPHGITVGIATNSPTNIADIKAGTCTSLVGTDIVQTASTSKGYDCAVSGVVSGDLVFPVISTSTPLTYTFGTFQLVAAKASTTAGYITLVYANLTGANAIPSAVGPQMGFASSTNYIVVKTQ